MKKGNNKGFSLVEIMIAIVIMTIVVMATLSLMPDEKARDTVRDAKLKELSTYLTNFKTQYGVYPTNGATGRKYPTGCSVSGYASLISCLVATNTLTEGTESYEGLRYDPSEGKRNEFDKEYTYYYGTAKNGNMFKVCALAGKQDNNLFKSLEGTDAPVGSRYLCITSDNTKLTDVTSLAK